MSIDVTWLSTWFVDNYIQKCSKLCPVNVSRLFDDVSTTMKLQNAVSAVIASLLDNAPVELWRALTLTVYGILLWMKDIPPRARACICLMTQLAKIDSGLSLYFTAIVFLHVAYKSLRNGLNEEFMDMLAHLLGENTCRKRCSNNSTSLLSLRKAVNLMKNAVNKSPGTMSLIAIELSKAYLYRALECEDSQSDSICCLSNVYLAVLYYATGQYQTAIDHCTLVIKSQDHSQCSLHVVQGELLPKVDDNVDNILGLTVFYQHIARAALNQQYQAQYVSVFTTEFFAYYLYIKYLSLKVCNKFPQTSSDAEFKRYEICISDTEQLFIGDVLLFVSLSQLLQQKVYQKPISQQLCQLTMNPTEHNASDLVELLHKSAVEHLTIFRHIEAQEVGSIVTIVTTDFEALYAYKRGDYQRCLQLCTQNVHALLYVDRLYGLQTCREFIQLMDDDIVSLTALMLIANPDCRRADSCCIYITQLTLSLYLMTQCQLKLHHSLSSLAQTLVYIKEDHRKHPVYATLDRLLLKMIAHKALSHMTTLCKCTHRPDDIHTRT